MRIVIKKHGHHRIVNLDGEFALHNVNTFKKILYKLIDSDNKSIIINMEKAAFLDSSVIGALIAVNEKLSSLKGNFALLHVNKDIDYILQMAGLGNYFKFYKSKAALTKMSRMA